MRYLITLILFGLVGLASVPSYAQDVNADLEQARKTASQLRQELRALKKEAQEAAAYEEQRVASQKKQEVLQTQRQAAAGVRQQPAPPAAVLEKFEQRLAAETDKITQIRDDVLAEQQSFRTQLTLVMAGLALLALLQLAVFWLVRSKLRPVSEQPELASAPIAALTSRPTFEPITWSAPEPVANPVADSEAEPILETVAEPIVNQPLVAEPVPIATVLEAQGDVDFEVAAEGIPKSAYERSLSQLAEQNRNLFMYLPDPV